uniref:FHA domain-containing protein n=1 Tax=Heliothis virescens TaxID=7102 RepID=A0A2A4JBM7_HELVI
MCPNHVEQYIDWKLVNSISATERVALWEKFSGPVDQQAVKVDFIRRAKKPRPAFRIKVPVCMRGRVAVPAMVRHHYRHPPPLLPSRREYVRCRNVLKNLKQTDCYDPTEEDEDAPKHKICMNLSCPVYDAEPAPLRGVTEEDAADDLHAISSEHIAQPERHTDSSSDLSDSDFEYLTASVKKRKVSSEDKSPSKRGKSERLELRPDANVEELLAVVDDQLKKLDERLVKLLAWQRLQQVIAGEQAFGSFRGCGVSAAARAALRRSLLSRADRARIAAAVWGGPRDPRPDSPTPPPSPGHSLSDAIVRATLCAITKPDKNGVGSGLGRPVPMRLSSLSVGADSGCDVRLDARACRNVSRHHAVIFMDEVCAHFN